MSKTPAEYRDIFSRIDQKMASSNPYDHELVTTDDFKEVVEHVINELNAEVPGMEGMMQFAQENGFNISAISGIWMAVGIAAATTGPRQNDWISQRASLISNLDGHRGFRSMVSAMSDAYQIATGGSRHDLAYLKPKIDLDEILLQIKESPEVKKAILDIAQDHQNLHIDGVLLQIKESPEVTQTLRDMAAEMAKSVGILDNQPLSLDDAISQIQHSPEVEKAIRAIVQDAAQKANASTPKAKSDGDGLSR